MTIFIIPEGFRRLLRLRYLMLLLPVIGFVATTPYLLLSPIYADELQWKLINSRLWLDGGKLIYFFPVCAKGFLLDVPISWYPSRVVDSLLFADMTDMQRLRFWGFGSFLTTVLYASWAAKRLLKIEAPLVCIFGAVLAPLTLGVLPFLLVLNRPEQPIVLSLVVGCTLPFVLATPPTGLARSWAFGTFYALLAWTMTAAHLKGVYFLPALLFSAFIVVRSWLPRIMLSSASVYSAAETLNIWLARTDCPESPFLTQVFNNLSLSPVDLASGWSSFINHWEANLLAAGTYWDRASFQLDYQNFWLPHSAVPLSIMEVFVNSATEIVIALGLVVVAVGIFRGLRTEQWRIALSGRAGVAAVLLALFLIALTRIQIVKSFYVEAIAYKVVEIAIALGGGVVGLRIVRDLKTEPWPAAWAVRAGVVAVLLVLSLIGLAGMQTTKNFYEASLGAPVLGLAVLLALPGALGSSVRARQIGLTAMVGIAFISSCSQAALATRFFENLPTWFRDIDDRKLNQANIHAAIDRCQLNFARDQGHVVMDELAYTVLWPVREPIMLFSFDRFWGTGVDLKNVVHERNIVGFVGKCTSVPSEYQPAAVAEGGYCCSRVDS